MMRKLFKNVIPSTTCEESRWRSLEPTPRVASALGMTLLAIALIFISGCAKKRPVKEVLPEVQRLEKGFFTEGQFYYTVTVVGVTADTPVTHVGDSNFGPSLAQFEFTEGHLTAYAPDPRFKEKSSRMKPVLSFPVENHVDIQRTKNGDDEETHIEEETDRERPFQDRKYAKINFARTNLLASDLLGLSVSKSFNQIKEISSDLIDLSQDSESLNITIRKGFEVAELGHTESLADIPSFSADIKISFLRKKENKSFKPTLMTDRHMNHIGFFPAIVKEYGKYNEDQEKKYASHWDPTKEIVFTLSQNFPKKYKSIAQKAINHWNDLLKDPKVAGKPLLKLKENQGEEIGDIRRPMIAWIDDPVEQGPIGYGPMHYDPFTGEMFQANVYLYAGNMRQFILYLLENREVYFDEKAENTGHSEYKNGLGLTVGKNLLDSKKDIENSPYLVKPFLKALQDEKTIEGALFKYRNLSGRCFYPGVAERADIGWYLGNLTEEELFEKYLADVLSHEIGHTLGLRHNFKGSVDKKHYISDEMPFSTTMDYLSLETNNSEGKPGPYDQAALSFAFGGEFDFQGNYLYCTDEDVMNDPMCNRFDQGSSAKEIAEYLAKRYEETYERRNLRGKRLSFINAMERNYTNQLLTHYFLPMRKFMDHTMWIKEHKTTLKGEPLREGEIHELLSDLTQATKVSFEFFTHIVTDSTKSYQDMPYLEKGPEELLVRGTKADKLLATQFLTLRSYKQSPSWSDTLKATYFDIPDYQTRLLSFYSDLIKNHETPLLIAIFSANMIINEIPKPSDIKSWKRISGIPSEAVLDLFTVNVRPLHELEAIQQNQDFSNQMEFVAVPEEGVMYTAKRQPIPFFLNETPAAYFIRIYREIQKQRELLLMAYDIKAEPLQRSQIALREAEEKQPIFNRILAQLSYRLEQKLLNDDLSNLSFEEQMLFSTWLTPQEYSDMVAGQMKGDEFIKKLKTKYEEEAEKLKEMKAAVEKEKRNLLLDSGAKNQETPSDNTNMEKEIQTIQQRIDVFAQIMSLSQQAEEAQSKLIQFIEQLPPLFIQGKLSADLSNLKRDIFNQWITLEEWKKIDASTTDKSNALIELLKAKHEEESKKLEEMEKTIETEKQKFNKEVGNDLLKAIYQHIEKEAQRIKFKIDLFYQMTRLRRTSIDD